MPVKLPETFAGKMISLCGKNPGNEGFYGYQ